MYPIAIAALAIFVCYLIKYLWKQEELSEKTLEKVTEKAFERTTEKTSSILAARKDELDAASKQWKSRVEKTDAVNFTVAGRMQEILPDITINLPARDKTKRTPRAKRFKGKEGERLVVALKCFACCFAVYLIWFPTRDTCIDRYDCGDGFE